MQNPSFSSIYFPFRLLFFYFIGLLFWRLTFAFYNDIPDIFSVILHSLRLDLSMICGAFLVGYIPWLIYLFFGQRWLIQANMYIQIILWTVICIVEFGSILLYKEWGSTVDSRALLYLYHPNEAVASIRDFIPWKMAALALIIYISGIKRLSLLFQNWQKVKSHYGQVIPFVMLIGPMAFLGLRGGWQKLPIVPSDAFYSQNMGQNFAATNKMWYMLYSIVKKTNLQTTSTDEEMDQFWTKYHSNPCVNDTIMASQKDKNIVIIILEGWSADMVQYLGGTEHVTPFFDSLSMHSYRFTNAFSTGFRTDQGLMSVLSGIPSIHSLNMPNVIDKVAKYPSLSREIKNKGYSTSFIYGGDLNFSNFYNYLALQGFDTIIGQRQFSNEDGLTDWGVPDHITAEKASSIIDQQKQPFFSTLLFLSSHSPFDVPWKNEWTNHEDIPSKYKSSVRYSDQSLSHFFSQIKDKTWFAQTIFYITSDHGSTHSGWAKMEDHNRFRIPLIVYDPSLNGTQTAKTIDIPCNHFDIPKTISDIQGLDSSHFIFGRNIFCGDESKSAYWNHDAVSGQYNLKNQEITPVNMPVSSDKTQTDAVTFLDVVKRWYNHLK